MLIKCAQALKVELEMIGDLLIVSEFGGRMVANNKFETKITILLRNCIMVHLEVVE
jgi:hypothetical protein